jgi:hypothetical protein
MGLFDNPITDRHCGRCEFWAADIAGGSHILCMYGDRKQVQPQPERGCVYWIRCVGADDEPGIGDAASNKPRR